MEDLNAELRKLDPSKLLGYLHYYDNFNTGDEIIIENWDEARIIYKEDMCPALANVIDTIIPSVVVEIKCPNVTYWVFIPVQFPTTHMVKEFSVELALTGPEGAFGVKAMVLPRNSTYVADSVVPLMGDFYAKF